MVEHRAIPNAADGERQRGQESGARASDATRGRPNRSDATNTGKTRKQMTNRIRIERENFLQSDGYDVEQAAIEIEIFEVEDGLIGQAAGVILYDQLAVALLNILVVGNAVVAESECNETDQRHEDEPGREIVSVDARKPPAGFGPQAGHRPDAPIEMPSGKLSCCHARQVHLCHFSDSPQGRHCAKTANRATPSSKLT